MQLRLQRSQRTKQGFAATTIFCLDVRAYLTPEETANVAKYGLSSLTLYNSEAAQRQVDKGKARMADGTIAGNLRGLGTMMLATLHLRVTVNSIVRGQHIECKTLDEMLAGEEAIVEACQNLKHYLKTAATFDGREMLFEFSGGDAEPKIVSAGDSLLKMPAQDTPIDAPALSTPEPVAQPGAAPNFAQMPLSSSFGSNDSEGPGGELGRKIGYWWQDLSSGQKIAVVIGGLFVLYVLTHIF